MVRQVCKVLKPVDESIILSQSGALPNAHMSSDHISIAAEFRLTENTTTTTTARPQGYPHHHHHHHHHHQTSNNNRKREIRYEDDDDDNNDDSNRSDVEDERVRAALRSRERGWESEESETGAAAAGGVAVISNGSNNGYRYGPSQGRGLQEVEEEEEEDGIWISEMDRFYG